MWWIRRAAVWLLKTLLILSLLVILISVLGPAFFEALFRLLCGWIFFLKRSLPLVHLEAGTIASGLVALIVAGFGLHFFSKSLLARALPDMAGWRARSTAALVTVVLLLFAVCIAGAGIVHQLSWLKTESWVEYSWINRGHPKERAKARSLGQMLEYWAQDHNGSYPAKLSDLFEENSSAANSEDMLLTRATTGATPEHWLFIGARRKRFDPQLPVIASPRPDQQGNRVVLLGDGSVVLLSEDKFQTMLGEVMRRPGEE